MAVMLGVSRQTIIAIENDKYNPTLELAMKIAKLLKTQVEQLFESEDYCELLLGENQSTGNVTKERLQGAINSIHQFKQMIAEQGSKEKTVDYLVKETGLSKEECESAFEFYNNIQLP
jgi:putative transcriptional regulator